LLELVGGKRADMVGLQPHQVNSTADSGKPALLGAVNK
jgi:hypothetical protein